MAQTGSHPLELKSTAEISKIRRAGHLLQRVIMEVARAVDVGVTTLELDRLAKSRIKEAGAIPAFLGMYGFPNTLCVSLNEAVVHGIPNKAPLNEGDLLSIDCGVLLDGFFADTAYTVGVGKCSAEAERLMQVTRESLELAIAKCQPGCRPGDIGHAVQTHVESNGFHVIRDYTGHGIGRHLHEDPKIENFGPAGKGKRLMPGTVIAVEPMVAVGTGDTEVLNDDWTVVTKDRSLSAHYEHTIAITQGGPEILTLAED
ncbi:type I methionyl aminopeptidase [bacterium]|nr:type I methionyl aminopeptidase [bacterium]